MVKVLEARTWDAKVDLETHKFQMVDIMDPRRWNAKVDLETQNSHMVDIMNPRPWYTQTDAQTTKVPMKKVTDSRMDKGRTITVKIKIKTGRTTNHLHRVVATTKTNP